MKQSGIARKPYTGHKKALVIALDVGTTFSGVSYSVLEPGEIPKIYEVTRFPGQEHQAGNPKVPTVIWYDRHGDAVKAGAEAEEQTAVNTAEEQGWIKVELFKLRLRPKSMKLDMNGMKLSHLPKSKSAIEVFGDFLKYLFRCTRSFIVESHAGGAAVWKSVENDIQFVLSHPNGWEGAQQSKMRKAAIYAGLLPNTDEGKARVRFVTEGEASLHACVLNGFADSVLLNPSQHQYGFVVADAGGGTLDISSYAIKAISPLLIEEIAPPDCLFSGSVFVSRRARKFLEHKLQGSPQYSTPAMLDHIAKRFDESTKRLFRNKGEVQFLNFGSPLDKDPAVGIRGGRLKLTGDEVAELFEPSIEAAVSSIRNQVTLSGGLIKTVWLVGGFASSPWLFTQLQERLGPDGIVVSRPDGQTSKAVADGAVGFYCDHHVGARVAKYMYGVEFLREFDETDPDHTERQSRLFQLPSGPKLLPDAFDCILARNSKVKESTTFSRKYCTELTSLSTLSVFEIEVWCYRGSGEQPKWILRGQDDFSTLCFVRADLSPLTASAKVMTGQGGKKYWTIVFSIEIHFGLTEFKARIKWNDDGKVKHGPASIVYDEGGNKELEDERDSQDETSLFPPSRYASRAPSMAPSRTHSMSNTPQTALSPVEDHSAVGTQMSRSLSTGQPPGERHPDGRVDPPVSKKSKSSSSHSHSKSRQLSPGPSNVSPHTPRTERSQHSPRSSQPPSHHSPSPRESPHHSSSPREVPRHPVSHPVSREPSQPGLQSGTSTPTSAVLIHHHDAEIPRSGHHTSNFYDATPAPPHLPESKQPTPSPSVLNDSTSSISRAHPRSKGVDTPTQPTDQTGVKFPAVSTGGSPYETPAPRSVKTSLTPSDSASNVHNYFYRNVTAPGTVVGSATGSVLPESTVSKKSKKDKNRSILSTITSESHSTTKPPTEQSQPPAPAPPIPEISIPPSPSVSSSIGGSRLTTNPNTPITTRSLKPSFTSSLSYVTDRSGQPPPQPPAMSRQNSDTGSVTAGGLGSALGGVLTGVWGAYKSANASPVVENPPPGPATAAFESTLETIQDVEIPGGFNGEREWDASHPSQWDIPQPVVIPPSPPKFEELDPLKAPGSNVGISNFPAPVEPESETVPQTPIEPEPSFLSAADRKKNKKQREKERKEKEAQDKKEREERERAEQEERAARERQEREEQEEKKRQGKADREARKKEREEQQRQEQAEKEAREKASREAWELSQREVQERVEREAKERRKEATERAEREARELAEREAKEANERAEREAKEQAEKAAVEKMDRVARKRAEKEAAKRAEQEAKEQAEREEKQRLEEAARVRAERTAQRKAEREAKIQAEREAREKADQEAREKSEREAKEKADREEQERLKKEERLKKKEEERLRKEEEERLRKEEEERLRKEEEERLEGERIEREKEKEKAEREAKQKAELEAKAEEEKRKAPVSKIPSPWGSTAGKNDRSRKTSALSQKEQKNEWAGRWDPDATQKDGLAPIITSSTQSGLLDGASDLNFLSFGNKDSPGGGEEVELRTPLTKRGKKGTDSPSSRSKVATPTEAAGVGKLDALEDLNMGNVSARISVSSRSENERWTDAEQSPTQPTPPTLAPEVGLENLLDTATELLGTPKGIRDEALATPKPWSSPSLTPARQSQVSTSPPIPAKTEPEKQLSLWERKKLKGADQPAPASSLFGGGDGMNSSGVWGDTSGGGGNAETIAMPTIVGDRQSVFTDTARDQKRENQRENVVEGLLGSNSARRRNDSAQSQTTTKPATKSAPAPAPAPAPQKSGWGSWGTSLLTNIASIAAPERSPSPEPASIKPKIEEPQRGFTPNQPPKSQPAGFGSLNQPAWGAGGRPGDSNAWGAAKPGPTPIAQTTSTGPAWGAKPAVSTFGSGGTSWGGQTAPTFGSGVSKNLSVDTTTKPLEGSPNTAGPENIPESAVEIKHVPAPGRFSSAITDKEETGDAQGDAWAWEEASGKGPKKAPKVPPPVQEKAPEPQVELTEDLAKAEEVATPAEEDEYDWANQTKKKKKKGQVASAVGTPSVPNTPDPDNAGGGTGGSGGGGGGKKKKKGKGGK